MRSPLLIVLIASILCASTAQAQTRSSRRNVKQAQSTGEKRKPAQQDQANPADKKQDDCGCETEAPPDVLAIVNGVRISSRSIDESLKDQIYALQRQALEARNRELDLQINSKLFAAEAKRRGITVARLMDEEVKSRIKEPTESEVRAFYEQNRDQIQAEFNDARTYLINYLRDQRQRDEARRFAERLRATAQFNILEEPTPPKTPADRARVLATVYGEPITSGDIEDSLRPFIYGVQEQIYTLRKGALDLKIREILLGQEAQKRDIAPEALLEMEVAPKIKKISEVDARTFYDQNKDRLEGDYAQLKDQIIQYLEQMERRNAESAFVEQLRRAASLQVFLTAPALPTYAIAADDQPLKGDAAAPVTIIEFTDFECPACARTQPIIEQLLKEYGNKVKLVVRDFPLQQHANAFKAAEAAEAAREQGKYWEYVAILFNNQSALGVDKLKEYASRLGLDRAKFDAALDSGKFAEKVQRDIQDGLNIGINSTPTVFINGRLNQEKTYESLKAAIEAALKEAAKQQASNNK